MEPGTKLERMRKKVYVAGPLSKGNMMSNIRDAINAGMPLWVAGYAVYIPHTTAFIDFVWYMDYEEWLKYDDEWLKVCDAVLRIPGESSGADREVKLAHSLGIPVFHSIESLCEAIPT
jgi:hypothetical protein